MVPQLAVVIPTYNERENVPLVLARVRAALAGVAHEVVFVDDDSPDGTAAVARELAQADASVRVLVRIGRRGLSSACIEGMLSTSAPFVAVMDADLQHDESILPEMLRRIQEENLELVIGSRNAEGGSMGEMRRERVALSRLGSRLAALVTGHKLMIR